MNRPLLLLSCCALVLPIWAGCSDSAEECAVGAKDCACNPDGICDDGLKCQADLCVADQGLDFTAFHAFVDQLPRALCDFYVSCGELTASEVAGCVAELLAELGTEEVRGCAAFRDFHQANQAELARCLAGELGTCKNDDVESFCPPLAGFDQARCESTTPLGDGTAGARCAADTECKDAMRCLQTQMGSKQRYCGPSCQSVEDCGAVSKSATNTGMALDASYGENHWNSDSLFRGVVCAAPLSPDKLPSDGDQQYCQYICVEQAGVVLDDSGAAVSCACWPNYKWADSSEKDQCLWDTAQECSIFKPCLPVAEPDPVCSGELRCLVNEDLEGSCVEFKSGEQIAACVQQCTADSCDSACLASCSGANCVELCCSFTCD